MNKFKCILLAALGLLVGTLAASAQLVTATITVTNTPADGDTIVLASVTRTFKTTVATPSSQVQIGSGANATATNLFQQLSANPITGTLLAFSSSNAMTLKGISLTATKTGSWGTIALSSSSVASLSAFMLPASAVPDQSAATNQASQAVTAIDNYATTSFAAGDTALINYCSLTLSQTLPGAKLFTGGISGLVGSFTNGGWLNGSLTNGQNFGDPFRSPGIGTGSEQFGIGASASTNFAIALGDGSAAGGVGSVAIGFTTSAQATGSIALGQNVVSQGNNAISIGLGSQSLSNANIAIGWDSVANNQFAEALGPLANAGGGFSVALGYNSQANFDSSSAIGQNSQTTTANQIALGTASDTVWIPGSLQIDGGLSDLVTDTTSTNVINGAIVVPSAAVTTFANSNNASLSIGTNSYVVVTGPTGPFYFSGIAGGFAGRVVWVENNSGQTMVVGQQSGVASAATDRIITGYGADRPFTNAPGVVTFRYDGSVSRWKIIASN